MPPARRGRLFVAAVVIALAAACGGTAVSPPPQPRPPRPKWPDLAAARSWPLAVPRGPSSGHAPPRFTLEIRVTPKESIPAYLDRTPAHAVPPGTRVAAFHETVEGEPASVYVLEKLPDGQWRPLVTDPDGTLVPGELGTCLSCHADAPADSLFGPRRPPAQEGP